MLMKYSSVKIVMGAIEWTARMRIIGIGLELANN